jgi:hypothetical protein
MAGPGSRSNIARSQGGQRFVPSAIQMSNVRGLLVSWRSPLLPGCSCGGLVGVREGGEADAGIRGQRFLLVAAELAIHQRGSTCGQAPTPQCPKKGKACVEQIILIIDYIYVVWLDWSIN